MATLNTAFRLATGALEADQAALGIVANNTANAGTPGYTRQTAIWQENDPVTLGGRSFGGGVTMAGARSQRDRVLEQSVQQQTAQESASASRLSVLSGVETIFNSSLSTGQDAGGIAAAISGFFGAFSQLTGNSTDLTLRQQAVAASQTLAQSVSGAATALGQHRAAADAGAASLAQQVNSLTASIAALNRQIEAASPAQDAGPLEDQRQYALTQLSQLVGIHVIPTEDNGLTVVTARGALLVAKDQAVSLSASASGGVTHFYSGAEDITAALTAGGGQLGGLLTARDQDIPQMMTALDQLAYGIATAANAQNAAGSDLSGAPGGNLFAPPAAVAGAAAGMTAVLTDPSRIAAAASGTGPGDSQNAQAMAALGSAPIVAGLGPAGYFAQFVSAVGGLVSGVSAGNAADQASLDQITAQRNALSSVDLNEEAAALESFEHAYQAAAKVFTTVNAIMASAINLGVPSAVS